MLFDTLVDRLEGAEIESVLAHELAHWKCNHIWKQLGAFAIQTAAVLAVLGALLSTDAVYDVFALPTHATYAGLFVGLLAVYPLVTLTAPLSNRLSLAHEREADRTVERQPVKSLDATPGGQDGDGPFTATPAGRVSVTPARPGVGRTVSTRTAAG